MTKDVDSSDLDLESVWDDGYFAELRRRSGDLEGAVPWEQLREQLLNEGDNSTVQESDSHQEDTATSKPPSPRHP